MGMDKEISPEIKKRRQRKLIIKLSILSCIVIMVFAVIIRTFSSGISEKEINEFTVDNGAIEITVSA